MTRVCKSDKPISNEGLRVCASSILRCHGLFWLILLTLAVCLATAVAGPKISKVRSGEHESFDRLVFEFEGKAQVGDPQESPGKIRLFFPDTTTELQTTQFENGTIRSVRFRREGQALSAGIEVAFDQFEYRLFALTEPDRIVLDVIPKQQPLALAASEKEEVGDAEERLAPRSKDSRLNSQGFGLGPAAEVQWESSNEALNVDSKVLEAGTLGIGAATRSLQRGPVVAESGMAVSAGFNWTPVGVAALVLFLIGWLSLACVRLLKNPAATDEKREPDEDVRKNIATIDALIRKEIRNFERLRWRKQE